MPGPPPKPSKVRQRQNKTTGARKLPAAGRRRAAPALPAKRPAWLKSTREWWKAIWASPMATVWLASDVPTLLRLAHLVDENARIVDPRFAAEIRQLEDRFGLSPLARRRLEWDIVAADVAVEKETSDEKPKRAKRSTSTGNVLSALK